MLSGGKLLSDPSSIDVFERTFDLKLPSAFVRGATAHDGGSFDPSGIDVFDPVLQRTERQSCEMLIDFGTGDMQATNGGRIDGLPKDVIAFARDAGGWVFAFDYRGLTERLDPAVVLFVPDYEDDQCILSVADSFDEFVARLVPLDEE